MFSLHRNDAGEQKKKDVFHSLFELFIMLEIVQNHFWKGVAFLCIFICKVNVSPRQIRLSISL